jgi:CBS domain-containing protein
VKRWLYANDSVRRSAADVEQRLHHVRELLQTATGSPLREPAGDGSFLLELPARALGGEHAKQVRVTTGPVRHQRGRTVLPLRWRAEPSGALFPVFEGALEVEVLAERLAGLTLVGAATPPLGPVGGLLDAVLLHGIAEDTADRLLRSLARVLDAPAEPAEPPRHGPGIDVAAVMTPAPIVVTEDTPLRACAELLLDAHVSGLPVLDGDGTLVGMLSEADLLPRIAAERFGFSRRLVHEQDLREARTAGAACSRPARCTAPDAPLGDAVREMLDHDVSRLAVLAGGHVVGIVTRHDVLAALTRDDASIAAEIRSILEDLGAGDLDLEVRTGHVRLGGTVDRRTVAEQLHRLVADVHGVDEVDDVHLAWRVDDLTPMMPGPFA